MWWQCFILLGLTGICLGTERNTVVLLGSDTQNQFKRVLLNLLVSEIDDSLDYNGYSFVVYQNERNSDHLRSLESPFIRRIPIDCGQLTVILATKGTDQMSLEEIRLFTEIIYQINGGIALINAGSQNVLTQTVIEQSVFCWGTARIRADLAVGEHQVQLCNGIKASELSILDSRMTPLHEHVDEIALPSMIQHRFWPSMFASAEPANQKAKSKHTDQPNARKERIYGKDKKKASSDGQQHVEYKKEEKKIERKIKKEKPKKQEIKEEKVEKVENKLDCKYRKSCYEGKEPPTAEEIKKQHTKKVTNTVSTHVTVNQQASEVDKKLECKYRTSCYKNNGIQLSEANEKKAHQHILTSKHGEVVHAQTKETLKAAAEKAIKDVKRQEKYAKEHPAEPNYETVLRESHRKLKSKEECKYRKSCYDTGILTEDTIRGIQSSQAAIPQSHTHIDVKDLKEDEVKLKCKYRKSCYETGNIDIDDKRPNPPPVYIPPEEKRHVNIEELKEDDKKLKCKYRKSCYETGDLDPEVIKAEQKKYVEPRRSEEFHKLDVMDKKLKCKYRTSCYESGVLPDLDANYVEVTIEKPAAEQNGHYSKELRCKYRKSCYDTGHLNVENEQETQILNHGEPVPTSKAELKLRCKYRPSCYQKLAQEAGEYANLIEGNEDDESDEEEEEEDRQDVEAIVEEPEDEDEEAEETDNDEGPLIVEIEQNEKEEETPEESDDTQAEEEVKEPENSDVTLASSTKKSKKYKVEPKIEGEQVPERPEHMKLKEKKAPAEEKVEEERPAKKDVERMKKNPDKRFVSKFKKVGNYEKLPKNEDEEEEHVDEELNDVPQEDEEEEEENKEELNEVLQEDEEEEEEVEPTPAFVAITQDEDKDSEGGEEGQQNYNDDEFARPADPLQCKYRKSCYRTGVLDLSHVPVYINPSETSKSSKKWEELKESDRKLACKYRKHCYDAGVLSEEHLEQPTVSHKYDDGEEKSEADRKLECKYRKSCYDEKNEKSHKSDERKGKGHKTPMLVVDNVQEKPDHDDDNDKDDDTDDEKPENKTVDPNSIPREARLICKYRHSCYSNVEEVVTTNPKMAMKMRGEKCNTYWKSCRDKLGLPVIERAPVDKQGRKLCRKTKKE
ncbi:unnamed protein product [Bursaphelenchus xylophilus]|uniref:(pine wood nematode) hypothetical protein n=1 Tax=Bursaphelenchus xylophilus TaxID=6326 RepID=A0A1I7STW9_BURXY|nr:unnamed protein product [Bursaphelenchus xylophilus]CAG9107856.1 unnamed protein product [Bursaphelenchus xylophilus]